MAVYMCSHPSDQNRIHLQHLMKPPCALSQSVSPKGNHDSNFCLHRFISSVLEPHGVLCLAAFTSHSAFETRLCCRVHQHSHLFIAL